MKILLILALATTFAVNAFPAHASLVFTLNQDGCSDTCGIGPFGTITVSQGNSSASVIITETLSPGVGFIRNGAGKALEFNIAGDPHIIISGLTTGFSVGPAPASAGKFGNFDYSIVCSGCGNNDDYPLPGPLTFTTTDGSTLTPFDFIANDKYVFFASEIVGGNGNTGVVASMGPNTIPEPFSLAILGSGLLCLSASRRKRI